MITTKIYFRKKITKIYLIILTVLLVSFLLLSSFITYFTKKQNSIYSNCSELVVINDTDIESNLLKMKDISNVKRILAFRENKNYDVFVESSYKTYDVNGNLIDSHEKTENKIIWDVLERENLQDYLLVLSDSEFNFKLADKEVAIGINDFWYHSYDSNTLNNILNQKIGFIFNDNNIEFKISKVFPSDKSFLIISDKLFQQLLKDSKNYTYTASVNSMRNQKKMKADLDSFSNNDSSFYSIITYYKNDSGDIVSNLYDVLDVLTLISYMSIIIFVIVLILILKNSINDMQKNMILNRKMGFSKLQIKLDILKNLFLLNVFAIIFSILFSVILIVILNFSYQLNLQLFNINLLLNIIVVEFIINLILGLTSSFKMKYDK